jgi:hypothetical protein
MSPGLLASPRTQTPPSPTVPHIFYIPTLPISKLKKPKKGENHFSFTEEILLFHMRKVKEKDILCLTKVTFSLGL